MHDAQFGLALAVLLATSSAYAQDKGGPSALTVTPARVNQWDAAAQVTWLGERLTDPSLLRNSGYEVATGGGTAGFYFTPHLKVEIDFSTSTEGTSYTVDQLAVPGEQFPLYLQREHRFRASRLSGGLNRQFFENAWFHPFVSAGIELLHERDRVRTTFLSARVPATAQAAGIETRTRYAARPFGGGGFKAYVSERAFIRSDVRLSISTDGVAAIAWRNGFGLDF